MRPTSRLQRRVREIKNFGEAAFDKKGFEKEATWRAGEKNREVNA
jgi:hypothetical protein